MSLNLTKSKYLNFSKKISKTPGNWNKNILTSFNKELDTYFEDIFENKAIVEHEDFIDGVLKLWQNNDLNELLALEKDLRNLLKYTEKSRGFDLPEISEDNYIMY
tara:strand:- start:860 stop:1174 length:315 start_codon:yes stop_codon:yes gene_type:complete